MLVLGHAQQLLHAARIHEQLCKPVVKNKYIKACSEMPSTGPEVQNGQATQDIFLPPLVSIMKGRLLVAVQCFLVQAANHAEHAGIASSPAACYSYVGNAAD